jgi:C-terminal processing protease CtpA/Prc
MTIRSLLLVTCAIAAAPCAAAAQQVITIQSDTPARGWLGLRWRLDPNFVIRSGQPRGTADNPPTVSLVEPGSPAALAGLRVGDAIVELNGVDTRGTPLFASREPGTRYLLRIRRGNEEREVALVVARNPEATAARTAVRPATHVASVPKRR